jgi:ABC-type transport system substrate-binding protein
MLTAPTATPTPAYADTLRIGWPLQNTGGVPGAIPGFRDTIGFVSYVGIPAINVASVVYSGLYRFDARFNAIPDLADGPCLPQGDGTVIRCRIVETTFHDGTPLTADDVAYSYQLFTRDAFDWSDTKPDVRVVDPRTVDFIVPSVDPLLLTSDLPETPILSRHAVEASYAAFVVATKDLRSANLAKLADAIDEELSSDPPVCTARLDATSSLLERIGVHLYREDFSRGHSATFDACSYMGMASGYIRHAADALAATGLDAVASAYWDLSINQRPIGTGPYRLESESANLIHLEAWPGYHGGAAATRDLDFVPATGDGSDLLAGSLDIAQGGANLGPAFLTAAAAHGVLLTTPPSSGFYALTFNVRPGRLFADVNLRKALQLCIDLPRDVDAATGGTGTPIYGPVLPGSWADDPTLARPARDTAAARKLSESAGWQLGADGIYAKAGVRLAAAIPVRGDKSDRVKMADLIALQARDCGMDLRSRPITFDDILDTLLQYPHDIPGTQTPFDLYLGGWSVVLDPADGLGLYATSNITDAKHPDGTIQANFTGFTDPVVDRLLEAAMSTYDQAERARLYRQVQQELAAQVPYVFLWASTSYDAVRSAVSTVDGPLDLTAPNWAWQPERLVVAANP